MLPLILGCLLFSVGKAEVAFKEDFQADVSSKWIDGQGKRFILAGQEPHLTEPMFLGFKSTYPNSHHAASAVVDPPFSNLNRALIFQFTVRLTRDPECEGAYIKLIPLGAVDSKFGRDSPFVVMFGPDYCGSLQRVLLQLNKVKEGESLLW